MPARYGPGVHPVSDPPDGRAWDAVGGERPGAAGGPRARCPGVREAGRTGCGVGFAPACRPRTAAGARGRIPAGRPWDRSPVPFRR